MPDPSPTRIRLTCLCGQVMEHLCRAHWDTSSALRPGTTWRSNATATTYWVLEVAADWVIYDDTPVASTDAHALRRVDFLTRFTYLGSAHQPQGPDTTDPKDA
ncbi:hypothetical protein J7I98_23740 [Streptomyces sp. ISL-98]|uniref:hypothetical protein n=1 Tax=Streptomyces sp. ISL-98 TaxID=2819192 RepID=UPI001BEA6715|nr:hypothetical protein [Streptomyces sp. ISL-98]MBT2508844.1 hypothetical protein [Streptomyces sp. ISL-98]